MLNDSLIQLLKLLQSDKNIRNKFSNIDNFDDLYNFCIEQVPGYTKNELKKFLILIDKLSFDKKFVNELGKELENVSGGDFNLRDFAQTMDNFSYKIDFLNNVTRKAGLGLNIYYKLDSGQELDMNDIQKLVSEISSTTMGHI